MLSRVVNSQYLLIVTISLFIVIINTSMVWGQTMFSPVLDLEWSPNGELLATLDAGGTLNVTRANDGYLQFEFQRPLLLIKAAVVWSPQGDLLAAGIGNRMYIWETTSWILLWEYEVGLPSGYFTRGPLENIPEGVSTIRWSLNSRYVVVGTHSYQTSVWDTQAGELIFREADLSGGGPGRVWLNEDGWMGDGANQLNAFTGEYAFPNPTVNNAVSGTAEGGTTEPNLDHTRIAWGYYTGSVLIIDLHASLRIQGFKVAEWEPPETRRVISSISWNGNGDFIAVAARDGELYVVNLVTEEIESVLILDGELNAIDWNPQTNDVTYAGVSDTGEPIFSTTDVSGIAGVPEISLTPTSMPTETPTFTPTYTETPTSTFTPTSTDTPSETPTPTFTSTCTPSNDDDTYPGDARLEWMQIVMQNIFDEKGW